MTTNQFITYQKFNDQGAALELETLFNDNGIECLLENTSSSFEPSFANNDLVKEFRVKLKKHDFVIADNLLEQIFLNQINTVDKDYYLHQFSNNELIELISKKDEWGQFDFLLAQKLLKERGKEIQPELIEELKKERLETLAKPEESSKIWIYIGYISSFLGGFMGILIGWHLLNHKKTLPNGDRVLGYTFEDRKHGENMVIIGVIFLIFWLVIKVLFFG
jgi:hypothetical protein